MTTATKPTEARPAFSEAAHVIADDGDGSAAYFARRSFHVLEALAIAHQCVTGEYPDDASVETGFAATIVRLMGRIARSSAEIVDGLNNGTLSDDTSDAPDVHPDPEARQ